MVKNHYRWDFIGLSTDTKPTPDTSEKVADGSTFYESDTSKYYVWCQDDWYEKTSTGGGGGGGGAVDTVNNVSPDSNGNVELTPSDIGAQAALTAGSNITIENETISATDTTYSDFVGATSETAGTAGLVPAPASGDTDKYLKSDGSWGTASSYTLPAASANTLGGVKIGSNLSMDGNDVLSATDTTYTAGTNVSISSGNVISATDTTYSNFVGTDGTAAGTAGLVPAPATTDAGKFLKADGTWDTAGSSVNVVQTTGTSTTDVMSQNAVTGMVFADPSTKNTVQIGNGSLSETTDGIAIGLNSRIYSSSTHAVAIGKYSRANGTLTTAIGGGTGSSSGVHTVAEGAGSTAIGGRSQASAKGAIALGSFSVANTVGQLDIGSTSTDYGYNNSNYRLLTGLYDPQSAHDAATKGYVDGTTESVTIADTDWSALSSSDPYTYSATKTLTATIGANSTVELINDAAVDFATYGFAIGAVDTANNTVTFYSIGAPSASKTLKVNIKG